LIQYQYFHTPRGYVPKITAGAESGVDQLFETVRKSVVDSESAFIYATVGSYRVFMQSSKRERDMYVKGLLADYVPEPPARFIDTFQKEVYEIDMAAETLPEDEFPYTDGVEWSFDLARRLNSCMLPKLVDALLYDKSGKQIVIITEKREDAVNYLKVLSMLLPQCVTERIGFALGTHSIPSEPLKWFREMESIGIGIQVWLPQLASFNYENYCNFYYVFDTVGNRTNYDSPLGAVSKLLEGVNLLDPFGEADQLVSFIASAVTSEGTLNLEKLEHDSVLYSFSIKRDPSTAKQVLQLGLSDSPEQMDSIKTAMALLLEPDNYVYIASEDRARILAFYRNSAEIAEEFGALIFDYYISSINSLNDSERTVFLEMIVSDTSGERYDKALDEFVSNESGVPEASFRFATQVLLSCFDKRGIPVCENAEFIRHTAEYFSYGELRTRIPMDEQMAGERFFEEIAKLPDAEQRYLFAAILMTTTYIKGAIPGGCELRIRGLKRMVTALGLNGVQTLETVVCVREKMLEILTELSGSYSDFEMAGGEEFLFNTVEGRNWLNGVINAMPMSDVLLCNITVHNLTMGGDSYIGMMSALRNRLLDIEFVKANIRSGGALVERYRNFYDSLPDILRESNVSVGSYLNSLNASEGISNAISRYRCNFTYRCFKTLSDSDVEKIKREGGMDAEFNSLSKPDRIRTVEATSRIFSDAQRRGARKRRGPATHLLLSAAAFGLVACFMLWLPAIIQVFALGDSVSFSAVMKRFAAIASPYYAIIPIAIYAMNLISYQCLREGKRLKRAGKLTVYCGIIPLAAFIISYLLSYFA